MNTLENPASQDSARHSSSISALKQALSVLAILLWWTLATVATAQPEAKPISTAKTGPAAQLCATPSPTCTPAQNTPPPVDGDLKFVVALFRHGVRSPLKAEDPPKHSGSPWPVLTDWSDGDKCANWGDLTPHGTTAATILGAWYGSNYSKVWGKNFTGYVWADVDERTQKTAAALATGLGASGISVTVESLAPATVDPLFHSFKAECGTPDPKELNKIVMKIRTKHEDWLGCFQDSLGQLENVFACKNACASPTPTPIPCEPLHCVKDKIGAWAPPTPTPGASPPAPTPTPRPTSPITWDGQFSYASTATETFLLEYANHMKPGWGNVAVGRDGSGPQLSDLLRLHEFYFDITERDEYLAGIQGANLLREILGQLNRKAGNPLDGECPHGDGSSQFVGLVGHDTNLAHLNKLLNITWTFHDDQLPADIRNLPDNDALPAGALVFELSERNLEHWVRIQYVTQSLSQIRNAPKPAEPYRLLTSCGVDCAPCEMSLGKFRNIAEAIIKSYCPFLSTCPGGKQPCP